MAANRETAPRSLGSTIGVGETLLAATAGGALAFLPIFLSPLRRMRELPSNEDPARGDNTSGPLVESWNADW